MAEKFEVAYGNDDGYAGGRRPHEFTIDTDDIWAGMTEEELKDRFWELMDEDFENRHKHLYSDQESEFIAWAQEQIAKMGE